MSSTTDKDQVPASQHMAQEKATSIALEELHDTSTKALYGLSPELITQMRDVWSNKAAQRTQPYTITRGIALLDLDSNFNFSIQSDSTKFKCCMIDVLTQRNKRIPSRRQSYRRACWEAKNTPNVFKDREQAIEDYKAGWFSDMPNPTIEELLFFAGMEKDTRVTAGKEMGMIEEDDRAEKVAMQAVQRVRAERKAPKKKKKKKKKQKQADPAVDALSESFKNFKIAFEELKPSEALETMLLMET